MSWDVLIQRYEGPLPSVRDIPDDLRFPPLGDADVVRGQINRIFPSVDWSDPAWGVLDRDGYSIEFNLGKEATLDSMMLHVRGGGDPVSAIARLCLANGWVAFDTSAGELMDLDHPSDGGWAAFQSYRDQIIAAVSRPVPWYRRLLERLRGRP